MFIIISLISFITVFIIFPVVFKFSISLQQNLVFTRWNLMANKTFYNNFRLPEYKNFYVDVKDIDNNGINLNLGLWHILPLDLAKIAIYEKDFDYNAGLNNSNYSAVLYFHGTGEDRSQSWQKYALLRLFFHVIVFDYRGYGDSDKGDMFEKNVVNDCLQVFQWIKNKTNSSIYIWGHSLGAALATSVVANLNLNNTDHNNNNNLIKGLILESSFTNLNEELYYHPYVKYFKWLPWFKSTISEPLKSNGFIFNTSKNILNVPCPILFLHAEDDKIVPYFMSENLYKTSLSRNVSDEIKNHTKLIRFNKMMGLNHYFIYRDSYMPFFINEFLRLTVSPVGNNNF